MGPSPHCRSINLPQASSTVQARCWARGHQTAAPGLHGHDLIVTETQNMTGLGVIAPRKSRGGRGPEGSSRKACPLGGDCEWTEVGGLREARAGRVLGRGHRL